MSEDQDWFLASMLRATFEFAQLAIKQLILINGGAVIVVLGYLGATAHESHEPDVFARHLIARSMYLFAWGVAAAAASAMTSYAAQQAADYERNSLKRPWLVALLPRVITVQAERPGSWGGVPCRGTGAVPPGKLSLWRKVA
jgi:hypothetical protein